MKMILCDNSTMVPIIEWLPNPLDPSMLIHEREYIFADVGHNGVLIWDCAEWQVKDKAWVDVESGAPGMFWNGDVAYWQKDIVICGLLPESTAERPHPIQAGINLPRVTTSMGGERAIVATGYNIGNTHKVIPETRS